MRLFSPQTRETLLLLPAIIEQIFGRGRRAAGWFERKLVRECVEPELCHVAEVDGRICGYVLMGRSRYCAELARTAGMGVLPEFRGKGLGRALLAGAFAACRQDGIKQVHTFAAPEARTFFMRCGYEDRGHVGTWMSHGTSSDPTSAPHALPDAGPWDCCDAKSQLAELSSWNRDAWEQDSASLRYTLIQAQPFFYSHVSREGQALLVQRVLVAKEFAHDARQLAWVECSLRQAICHETPLLWGFVPRGSEVERMLKAQGWLLAQSSMRLSRHL